MNIRNVKLFAAKYLHTHTYKCMHGPCNMHGLTEGGLFFAYICTCREKNTEKSKEKAISRNVMHGFAHFLCLEMDPFRRRRRRFSLQQEQEKKRGPGEKKMLTANFEDLF